jgi:hypothetical protein
MAHPVVHFEVSGKDLDNTRTSVALRTLIQRSSHYAQPSTYRTAAFPNEICVTRPPADTSNRICQCGLERRVRK